MTDKRLEEIKDSIDLQLLVAESIGTKDIIAEEEKELFNEIERLNKNWNELEKWLNEKWKKPLAQIYVSDVVEEINKLKELKGDSNVKDKR